MSARRLPFVLGRNVARRHLTPSQTAMAVQDVLAIFEAEAKERQEAAGKEHGRGTKRSAPTGAQLSPPKRAVEDAAKAAGSTPRSVQRAKRVDAIEGPDE